MTTSSYNATTVFMLCRLREFDIGREVSYRPTHLDPAAKPVVGTLVGWDELHAFIRFGNGEPQVCNPHFLKFAKPVRAVGGRGNKAT